MFWNCALAMKECKHENYVVSREKMTMEEALKKYRDLSFCEDWVLDGAEKGEHEKMKEEFQKHKEWLKFASKCKEMWQEFEGIPSPLPSCKITKTVCDYEHCPKNVWKETKAQ